MKKFGKRDLVDIGGLVIISLRRIRSFRGHIRIFDVCLDGRLVAELAMEKEIDICCSEGTHYISVRLDGIESPILEVTAQAGETIRLDTICSVRDGLEIYERKDEDVG